MLNQIKERFILVVTLEAKADEAQKNYSAYCGKVYDAIDAGRVKMNPKINRKFRYLSKMAEDAKFRLLEACK